MGNDHALEIAGIGTIKIKMHGDTVCTIQEVRHVKGLKKNLLSLGQLDDLGCKSHIENGIMKIARGVLVVIRVEKIVANLYMLKGETLHEADACVVSSNHGEESTMMWHRKLGNISERGLKILSNRNLLPGLKLVNMSFCEHCVTKTTEVQVEDNPEQEDLDSSKAAPEHEVQEPIDPDAIEARRTTHERRPPAWHSEYVTESNVAYCLITEDEEPLTFHEARNSSDASLWMTAMHE
ncbi:hypothetical protein LWI28_001624 [Acer negundo]|uniref:GAG-pre-integrase domain-containing protein n=1 Tax=Acer negundo TaxID=4023 RepID=A0AAD5IWZ4_ACENE|nr:hypothetical protein LWI28_001624 [Acer negundo]